MMRRVGVTLWKPSPTLWATLAVMLVTLVAVWFWLDLYLAVVLILVVAVVGWQRLAS